MPTVLDIAGIEPPESVRGYSLKSVLEGERDWVDPRGHTDLSGAHPDLVAAFKARIEAWKRDIEMPEAIPFYEQAGGARARCAT